MNEMKRIVIAFITVLITAGGFSENTEIGTTGFTFLKVPYGARQQGLGGAFASGWGDANSLYWNPSGTGTIARTQFAFTHAEWFFNTRYDCIGAAIPVENIGVFGTGVSYWNISDIQETNEEYKYGTGRFVSVNFLTTTVSYGREVYETKIMKQNYAFFAGGNIKFIYQQLDVVKSYAVSGDAGFLIKPDKDGPGLGISVLNIGRKTKIYEKEESLPLLFKAGLSYALLNKSLFIALDVDRYIDSDVKIYCGAEYWIADFIAVRAGGSSNFRDFFWSIGASIKVINYRIDYAFVPYKELGNTHHITLLFEI